GMRTVSFELNGQSRRVRVRDHSFQATKAVHRKAKDTGEVGSPLQGRIASVLVQKGDVVQEGAPLFTIEAMKMESTVTSPVAGTVEEVILSEGEMVEQDDLVIAVG
ncbi:MAG: biotin/lipoyl-containing protein, partial [Cyclobacteriaceae bacterium]